MAVLFLPYTTEHGFLPLATYTLLQKWSFSSLPSPDCCSLHFQSRSSSIQRGYLRQRSFRITSESTAEVWWQFRRRTRIMSYKWCTKPYLFTSQSKNSVITSNISYVNSIGKYRKTTRSFPACSTVSQPAPTESKGWGLCLFTFSLSPFLFFWFWPQPTLK